VYKIRYTTAHLVRHHGFSGEERLINLVNSKKRFFFYEGAILQVLGESFRMKKPKKKIVPGG
jgi:hypothetical protein